MTPNQVLETIRDQVYETSANFWSDAEIYRYMWTAECELASLIECTEATCTAIPTVANQQEYTKPTNLIDIKRVTYGNKPLKKVTKREKDFYDFNLVDGTDFSGEPDSFYEWAALIGLYPIPTEVKSLTIYGIVQPTVITSASVAFTVPQEYTHYFIDFCLHRMYAKDQDETRSDRHFKIWENNLVKAKDKWMRKRVSGKVFVVKTEDQYPTTELGLI
jgi:hypothetical protein